MWVESGAVRYGATYPTTLTSGQWYHIMGVYDGANIKIYVNNSVTVGDGLTGNIDSTTYEWSIGAMSTGERPCNMVCSEAYIYNRALTPQEIQRNYLGTKFRYQ